MVVRGLLLRGRTPSGVSEVGKAGTRRWTLLLLLLIPLAVVVTWTSVRVSNATELAFFVGFFVFSAAADRTAGVLVVHAIHEDEPFGPALRRAVDDEVEALGRWLGLGVDAGQ